MVRKVDAIETSDTSNLVTKEDYDTKIKEIEDKTPDHNKYITAKDFNKF